MKIRYYRRDGTPYKDVAEWAEDYDNVDPRIALDVIKDTRISTVWLGLNHNHGKGKPLIFETMIFFDNEDIDEYMERYSTENEAIEGHKRIVRDFKNGTLEVAWKQSSTKCKPTN